MYRSFIFLLLLLCSSVVRAQLPDKATEICPILTGQELPKSSLVSLEGEEVSLYKIIRDKPTVLVFYRGGWCPYCTAQLSALGGIQGDIQALGYQTVAISPDAYTELRSTLEEPEISYPLYSDAEGQLIQKLGIAYKTPLKIKGYLATKKREGKTSEVMPVPSVLVVDQDGLILFEYINPDYKTRLSADVLLAVLSKLKT